VDREGVSLNEITVSFTELDKVLIGLGSLLLSAFLSYRLGRRSVLEDRKQRAKDLATAFLIELRYIEGPLREMYSESQPLNYFWYLPLPWFQKLFDEARYFRPTTTHAAYDFYGLILELNARRETAARLKTIEAAFQHSYRVKVAFTLGRLAILVKELEKEGGVRTPLLGLEKSKPGELPDPPPRIFPELDDAKETKGTRLPR
jgi:hypothetical protein